MKALLMRDKQPSKSFYVKWSNIRKRIPRNHHTFITGAFDTFSFLTPKIRSMDILASPKIYA